MTERSITYLDGWKAHELGAECNANPFDEVTQYHSHDQWRSGWCDRFGAIKHERDLSLDVEYRHITGE